MDSVAQENKILKKVIDELISIDQGIYPKSIEGSNYTDYQKRTPYMEGWNAALIEHMEMVCKILDENDVRIINDEVIVKGNK